MKKCQKCGTEFPDEYQFCLKDGSDLIVLLMQQSEPMSKNVEFAETLLVEQEVFSISKQLENPLVKIGLGFGVIVLIAFFISLYNSSSKPANAVTQYSNANTNLAFNPGRNIATNTAPPANAVSSGDSDYRIGKTGRLDTNLVMRSASNKNASQSGVHYQGARIQVLGVDEYDTVNGFSTWFLVQVIEDGCDAKGQLGCGHEGNSEGWMNARYITLE
jgi:hypothetical protein